MFISGYIKALARSVQIIGIAAAAILSHTQAFAAQTISIQTFSSLGAYGTQVNTPLPVYTLHISNGKLVDDSGVAFNSYQPQWTTPAAGSSCVIPNLGWAAVYTTFYVVLANDQDHLRIVRSCGKSPLQMNSSAQYGNISSSNFINHAQIAGKVNGTNNVNQVIAAGELDVIDGKIVYMDTCSGHFQPNVGSFLAYASKLDGQGALSLTSALKGIIATGSISDQQISANLTQMVNNGGVVPQRNVRVGTGGCYSYTTVFAVGRANGTTTLSGGLMALNQGGAKVFMNNINAITNQNVKDITLTPNCCIYSYAANVITDLHFWNNALNFKFTDETNDTYSLSVHVYSYNHEVDYNSSKPNINRITFDWTP